jgi:hypothetical protein
MRWLVPGARAMLLNVKMRPSSFYNRHQRRRMARRTPLTHTARTS